jgi:hypothetical protein
MFYKKRLQNFIMTIINKRRDVREEQFRMHNNESSLFRLALPNLY